MAHQWVLPTLAGVTLPPRLLQIVQVFAESPKEFRVQALLDFGNRIPPLPADLAAGRESLEQVHECATPFFLATRVEPGGAVHMFFDAPPESPTVRGFAGILYAGLDGEPADAVLTVPDDFFYGMGLEEVVTTQRLRGMAAILARLKRQIRERRPAPAT